MFDPCAPARDIAHAISHGLEHEVTALGMAWLVQWVAVREDRFATRWTVDGMRTRDAKALLHLVGSHTDEVVKIVEKLGVDQITPEVLAEYEMFLNELEAGS